VTVSLFLYGTLRHMPLLEIVLGRSADRIAAQPARLADHAVSRVADQSFPMIVVAPGEMAHGLMVDDLSSDDVARINYYEGGFGYSLREVPVQIAGGTVAAQVYFPAPGQWSPAEPWDLAAWVADHAEFTCALANEKMWSRPFMPASGVILPHNEMMMRQRASARLAAVSRPGPRDRDLAEDVILHSRMRGYAGFFAFDELELQYRRYDGTMSEVLNRGYLAHAEAVVVLIYDPARDMVLTVEQFRAPLYGSGDPSPWVWEAVAGLIDAGETPEEAARRETVEEAGVHLDALSICISSSGWPTCRAMAAAGLRPKARIFALGCAAMTRSWHGWMRAIAKMRRFWSLCSGWPGIGMSCGPDDHKNAPRAWQRRGIPCGAGLARLHRVRQIDRED